MGTQEAKTRNFSKSANTHLLQMKNP